MFIWNVKIDAFLENILYIKATMVSVYLFVCGDKQGRARQGGQGKHPPAVFSYR
jgi:hypothetical protein